MRIRALLLTAVGLVACVSPPPPSVRPRTAPFSYADPATLSLLPFPAVAFQPDGLADGSRQTVLRESLALPLIRASRRPVALVLFQLFPALPEQLGVHVYWVGGGYHSVLLHRRDGKDPDFSAYEPFLEFLQELSAESD